MENIGVKLAFETLPGGSVKESIVRTGGMVTSSKTLTPNDWEAKVAAMQKTE